MLNRLEIKNFSNCISHKSFYDSEETKEFVFESRNLVRLKLFYEHISLLQICTKLYLLHGTVRGLCDGIFRSNSSIKLLVNDQHGCRFTFTTRFKIDRIRSDTSSKTKKCAIRASRVILSYCRLHKLT